MACGKTQDEVDYMYDSSVCRVCKKNPINVNIGVDLNWDNEWSFEGHVCTDCYDYVLRPILEGKCTPHIQDFKDKVKLKDKLSTDFFAPPKKWVGKKHRFRKDPFD